MPTGVANRYARALADVAERQGNYREIERELKDFAAAYRESSDLREVFETPAVPPEGKLKVLEAILERLGVSKVTSNFLHVLTAHYRMPLLEEIIPAFVSISNDRQGIVEVKVFAPTEISGTTLQALRASFERVTGKQVEVEFQRQEDLIGGLLAQIRSTVYDGSVRGRLDRIREKLTVR